MPVLVSVSVSVSGLKLGLVGLELGVVLEK